MQGPVAITGPDGAPFELAVHPQETVLPLAWLAHATDGPVRCPAAGGLVEILDGPTMLFELTDIGLQAVALASAQAGLGADLRPAADRSAAASRAASPRHASRRLGAAGRPHRRRTARQPARLRH